MSFSADDLRTIGPPVPFEGDGARVDLFLSRKYPFYSRSAWSALCRAGELLVNSIDADGTKQGFDLELTALMHELSSVPVIASGGAGAVGDFAPAVAAGADAVLAASVFHNGEITIAEVKAALAAEGRILR